MSPLLQEKLIDLLVNFISIVAGGGLVFLIIEWRRHKREKMQWDTEDQLLQIDIPRAEMHITYWDINDEMEDKEKLLVYEKEILGKVRNLLIVTEFVIRNTTSREIVITSYSARPLGTTSDYTVIDYYDLESFDVISVEDIGAFRLIPFGAVPRYGILRYISFSGNKIDTIPDTLVIEVNTSSGKVVQIKKELNVTRAMPNDIYLHERRYRPRKYWQKVGVVMEDDIPF